MYPVLLQLGPLSIRSWGVLLVVAFIVGARVAAAEARRKGLEPDLVHDFTLWALLGGVVGGRLYEVLLLDPAWYARHPRQILTGWQGGMAFCGALLGGTAAAILFTRRRKVGFWRFADVLAPGLVLGQAFGRLGSFLDGEAYGVPTTVAWAVTYTEPSGLAPLHVRLHPVQVYEVIGDLALFAVLLALRRRQGFEGQLALEYAMWYAVLRGLTASVQADAIWIGEMVSADHIWAAAVGLFALMLWVSRDRRSRNPAPP